MFSNPKRKQRNITYLPSFQTDIETILRLVLTVLRKMPLLQYYNIFNPSEVIYTQDKRILDITALSLYDKQNNKWLLVDMEFLFSCSTRHLTRSLCPLVNYRFKHSKRNSISTRAHVLFSIYQPVASWFV